MGYLASYDAVIAPITLRDAWPHLTAPNDNMVHIDSVGSKPLDVDGSARRYDDGLFWQHVPKICSLPSTSFPAGKSRAGLPIGLQAFGKQHSDLTLLSLVGHPVEQLGTEQRAPPPGFE